MMKISRTEIFDDYILIVFEGTINLPRVFEFVIPVIKMCYEQKKRKLLVDASRVEGDLSTTMRFEFFTRVADLSIQMEIQHGVSIKSAYYGKAPLVDPERFGKIVGLNRGLNVNVFTDYQDAVSWLLEP